MRYYGRSGYRVSTFVNQVHAAVTAKYDKLKSNDSDQAIKLQSFLQEIKQAGQNRKKGQPIKNAAIEQIIDSIQEIMDSQKHGQLVSTLFQRRGGARFERQLEMVILAVLNNVSTEKISLGQYQINIGSMKADSILDVLTDKISQKVLIELKTKAQKKITDEAGKVKKVYYNPQVDGKIDIKGVQINVRADADPKILEYYNLLKNATFTAKNYDSLTWDEKAEDFIQQVGHTTIKLGNTNPFRSIYSVLTDLGYDEDTSKSAFYAGWHRVNQNDENVSTHFFHLRYIYELTGAGLTYNGQSFGEARFLVYNDPHGGIYVKSTSEILSDILNSRQNVNNALSGISIAKSVLSSIGQL